MNRNCAQCNQRGRNNRVYQGGAQAANGRFFQNGFRFPAIPQPNGAYNSFMPRRNTQRQPIMQPPAQQPQPMPPQETHTPANAQNPQHAPQATLSPNQMQAARAAGITFEPVNPAGTPPGIPAPATPLNIPATAFIQGLAAFAQDERNGAAFYKRLSNAASSDWDSALLAELADNCLTRSARAAELVRAHSATPFDTEPRETRGDMRYGDGVVLAVQTESRCIDALAALLEQAEDERVARAVHGLLARKMGDYGKLLLLR